MYEAYFQFQGCPFPATPIVANYFPAQAIESARQSLMRVIERAEGPGFVVGPAGVGKSLLLRTLAEHFSGVFRVVLLSGTRIATRKSLLQSILFELGLPYRGMDEGELRLGLIDALRPSDKCPNGILLLVDEAHTLPFRLLDEIRMMTNVVRDGQPRARLVLAGGPQLEERFANPKIESLSQRIAARCYLHALTRDETAEFVRAQLSWVGGDPDALLADDATRAIYQASDGIPRLVNQICDHALILAESRGVRQLSATLIQEAWADLQQLPPPWQTANTEPAASAHTVIEFGELEDSVPAAQAETDGGDPKRASAEASADESDESDAVELSYEALAGWGELDPPNPLLPSLPAEFELPAAVVCASSCEDYGVEWFDGGTAEQPAAEPTRAHNPFADPFEEEVVVIDQTTATEIEAFRGRPRVSCLEGRRMAASLQQLLPEPAPAPRDPLSTSLPAGNSEGLVAASADVVPEFEYTTMQLVDDIMQVGSEALQSESASLEVRGTVCDALDQIEHDLDEEIDSVPLPWTRPAVGDDRDVIIVEEDTPDVNMFPTEEPCDRPRRMEYRELFAQLRRTSS